jgi:hypothetical protein
MATFERFAEVCPIAITPGSVTKRHPPEPDVVCEFTAAREMVAFELIEIVDQGFARLEAGQSRDMELLRKAYCEAHSVLREALRERLGTVSVTVAFERRSSSRDRRASIPTVLHELSRLPAGFEGQWRPQPGSQLHERVWYIRVKRSQCDGIRFYVSANTSVGDPTVDLVKSKWCKTYETTRPIELLAYYALQPVAPEAWWLERLESFVEGNWGTGPFRRVWLFESWSSTILATIQRPNEPRGAA